MGDLDGFFSGVEWLFGWFPSCGDCLSVGGCTGNGKMFV